MILYSNADGKEALTVFGSGGRTAVVTGEHPSFKEILHTAMNNEEDKAIELVDLAQAVSDRFEAITERVTVRNGIVYFDGDAVHNTLTNQIVRFMREGVDFQPLVNFMERVQQNPNDHSREQLWRWLDDRDFTITPDGCFIGYKGVTRSGDKLVSINSGKAIVDGKPVTGKIEQRIGSVITMPRSEVQHDPAIGCHTGLHVGTWSYASSFGNGIVLEVEVDPRDVVSVPTDCNDEKLRCCRYTVLDEIDAPRTTAYSGSSDEEDYYAYDDEYDECDCEYCEEQREEEERAELRAFEEY